MSKREIGRKEHLYNLGDYDFTTLNKLTYDELFELISMLNNNLKAQKERNSIITQRIYKLSDYLKNQGLTDEDINNIIRLDCENGW